MKRIIQTVAGASALLILAACGGGSDGAAGVGRLTVDNLTPLNGSDTIIGTWIGATDFTETGSLYGLTATLTGSRMVTVQIKGDGTGGYELTSCKGDHATVVELNPETGAVSAIGRDFIMTNFNEMSGSSTKTEWVNNDQGQEDWSWVKVSNSTDGIGTIVSNYTPNGSQTFSATNELSALCRESLTYTDPEESWTTVADSAAYSSNGIKYFYAQKDSDGWRVAEVPELGINIETDESEAELNVVSSSISAYQANYSVTTAGYAFTASLNQVISE